MKKLLSSLVVILTLSVSFAWAADYPRNQALYVTMRDDVKIAIDVWLPEDLDNTENIPALIKATRYWRARQNVSGNYEDDNRFAEAEQVNQAGYALVKRQTTERLSTGSSLNPGPINGSGPMVCPMPATRRRC
jgi:hypothetical protein